MLGIVLTFSFLYYSAVFISEVCGKNVCARCFAKKKSDLMKEQEAMEEAELMMNPMSGGGMGGAPEYGINPLVAAMLNQGNDGQRTGKDWEMIRKELERMQKVNKKLHGEVKSLKKKLEDAELAGQGGPIKAKKKGRKKKEFGGGTIGHSGSVHSRAGGKKGGARPISMADHGRLGDANDALVMQNPMVAHPGAHHQPQAGVVTLKGDWIEATDPASGHKYWHNAQTGESTWVDPNAKDGKGIRRELSMG